MLVSAASGAGVMVWKVVLMSCLWSVSGFLCVLKGVYWML